MKTQELIIGNFIDFEDDFYTVESISNDGWLQLDNDQLNTHLSACKPIKITREWLINFGFKPCGNDIRFWRKDSVKLKITDKGYKFNYGESILYIKNVHQLQNLYYTLTSTEVKFKEIK
jgi:hypothetical protein